MAESKTTVVKKLISYLILKAIFKASERFYLISS